MAAMRAARGQRGPYPPQCAPCALGPMLSSAAQYRGDHRTPRLRRNRNIQRCAGFADGVIVASALVKAILDAPDAAAGTATVAKLAAELSLATRRHAD